MIIDRDNILVKNKLYKFIDIKDNHKHFFTIDKVVETNEKKKYPSKQYNDKFREKNAEKLAIKVNCSCGGYFTYYSMSKHLKSKKHLMRITRRIPIEPIDE